MQFFETVQLFVRTFGDKPVMPMKAAATSSQLKPRISTRAVATQVTGLTGQTMLLSVLIRQNITASQARVPGLPYLPGIGHLSGTHSTGQARIELIVPITPRSAAPPTKCHAIDGHPQQMQPLTL